MNDTALQETENEARRLLQRIKELRDAAKEPGGQYLMMGSAQTSAVRRQSMELTRALARLRKP